MFFFAQACRARAESEVGPTGLAGLSLGIANSTSVISVGASVPVGACGCPIGSCPWGSPELRSCQYVLRHAGHFHAPHRRLEERHCHRCCRHSSEASCHETCLGALVVAATEGLIDAPHTCPHVVEEPDAMKKPARTQLA